MPQRKSKAYADAGVNLEAADTLVSRLKAIVGATHTKGVLSDIGGFGGLYKPDLEGMDEPVLVASTDGVGTKIKLAVDFNRHDTIGIDLVAMSVNDVLVQGARPLFFLDYFATGRLDPDVAETIIAGVAEGCKRAGCALLGGETAEMPGMYAEGDYDLAGFCVGLADNNKIVDGSGLHMGDAVIGLASSGFHSNGYSLVRKILAQEGLKADDPMPGLAEGDNRTVADALLEPTTIYTKPVLNLLRDFEVKSMAHITGGGFYDNIPRVLPQGVEARIQFGSWDIPGVFHWLKDAAGLTWPEMLHIFNCGIGYILIVEEEHEAEILNRLRRAFLHPAWIIGRIEKQEQRGAEQVVIDFPRSAR